MMMCSDCGGIIVFQGCNSMQKIFENIGNVGTGMKIFMIFMSRGRFLCVLWFIPEINLCFLSVLRHSTKL